MRHTAERAFTHFWAYGVIRRGCSSPYLLDMPGETPMRIIYNSYTPADFGTSHRRWSRIGARFRSTMTTFWAYRVPKFSAALAGIGDLVYSYGSLQLYRVHKPPAVLEKWPNAASH